MKVNVYNILLLIIIHLASGTLSPSDRSKNKSSSKSKFKTGPQSQNVFQRNLVKSSPSFKEILVENGGYYFNTSARLFNGLVLGYVTPWNNHGYDVSKIWAAKFDLISPVWFQLNKKGKLEYSIAGKQDIDKNWIKDVRKSSNQNVQIVPRIILDKFTSTDLYDLLSNVKEQKTLNKYISNFCKINGFDGIVYEIWSQLHGNIEDSILLGLIKNMAITLGEYGLKMILVIPPKKDQLNSFSSYHFNELTKYIYAFSLMTYDYSPANRPGPNAPLDWMKDAVESIVPETDKDFKMKRQQILMGLNMYGYNFKLDGVTAVVSHEFLKLAEYGKDHLIYDENSVEHFFEVKTPTARNTIFYPTLYSINERIKLAHKLNVGISLWELGQGLDYFYDLF